ncbi:MAG: SDR family NAD(P)-dependent oxidoreductase, partial [Candidatus Aminicenantes bacterium]
PPLCFEKIEILLRELAVEAKAIEEMDISYRGGKRLVRRIEEFFPGKDAGIPLPIKEKGVYLITGGIGGLGLIFAEFLAREYRARLVLTDRAAPDVEIRERLNQLEGLGAEVLYIEADISREQDVEALIGKAKSRFKQIDGIIHSAGVIRDALIINKTREQMEAVLAPKVCGAVWLDKLTSGESLDFFVLFSAAAGVVGNVGQCDYAYANRFMDHFVHWRVNRQRPGKTLSINWPLWKHGGMKMNKETGRLLQRHYGMKPLETGAGLEIFKWGLQQPETRFMVLEAHPIKIRSIMGFNRDHSGETQTPVSMEQLNPTPGGPGSQVKNHLGAAAAEEGLGQELRKDLVKGVSAVLKIDESDIDMESHLSEFGFDSISFTEYSILLNDKYNLELMPSVLFEHPTLASFARYLLQEYRDRLWTYYRDKLMVCGSHQGMDTAVPGLETAAAGSEPHQLRARFLSSVSLPGEPGDVLSMAGKSPLAAPVPGSESIAIIGMSGVMPQSENLEEFWCSLEAGKDLITEIPPDRWDWREWYGDPSKEANKTNVKWGGFMKEVDRFDAEFFGISPREAEVMDPQQRIFMETVWQTIEDAGYRASGLSGTKTGLFVGAAARDYSELLNAHGLGMHVLASTGGVHAVLANRISYTLNLNGPSEPVDTACSSSLVAIHRAVRSICSQECDLAIAGGVNVLLNPCWYIAYSTAGMLSGDGKCKTFDKRANGYVRGEGCGAILLKPLSQARADGDHIYAVIKATAVNHGGRAPSLTSPNPNAQADLIVKAWKESGIHPATVTYIETHGTGTSLGDPIEINGLKKAFDRVYREWEKSAAPTVPQVHCGLGAVKTNIGHLEVAAGIASVIKVLLAMKHKKIPGNLHFQELNPYIRLEGSPFYIVNQTIPWQRLKDEEGQDIPRRAGISSFGYSGVNAHVVLEEWPEVRESVGQSVTKSVQPQLILLSAKNKEQLKAYAEKMRSFLNKTSDSLEDIAYTLQVGRESMDERLVVIVSGMQELQEKLAAFCQGKEDIEHLYVGNTKDSKSELEQLVEGAAGKEFVRGIMNSREYAKLARLWVSGVGIDWKLLYTDRLRQRISLPGYPFAGKRYWALDGSRASPGSGGKNGRSSGLHILIDSEVKEDNGSAPKGPDRGPAVPRFKKRFSGQEFFIEDHIHTLPAVVYLEMLRAAGNLAHRYSRVNRFQDVVWSHPLIVKGQPKEVTIELHQSKKSHRIGFRVIATGKGKNHQELQPIVHCRGMLGYAGASRGGSAGQNREERFIDIDQLLKRCQGGKNKAVDFYRQLSNHGSHLGPRFKSIREFYYNEKEALSRVEIRQELEKDLHEYVLHPTLIDSAIQSTVALGYLSGFNNQWDYLPYVLGELKIVKTGSRVCYAYVWLVRDQADAPPEKKRWNALLLDKDGNVLVRIEHLVLRPLQPTQTGGDAYQTGALTETLYYQPVWKRSLWQIPFLSQGPTVRQRHPDKREKENLLILAPHRQLIDGWQEKYPGTVILVKPGERYQPPEVPEDHGFYIYEVNPEVERDYDRLVESLNERDILPHQVVHSWTQPGTFFGGKALETQLKLGVYSVFYLSRSLQKVKAKLADRVPFLYFYPAHREIMYSPGYAAAAAVSGFTRSAFLESGTLAYKTIGIDMSRLSSSQRFPGYFMEIVLQEIEGEDHVFTGNGKGNEAEILYEGDLRRVKHLEEVKPGIKEEPGKLKENGVYLVTGGLGGLGMMIARHLAVKFKAKLVLADCIEASPLMEKKIQELQSSAPGSEIVYMKADINCQPEVETLVTATRTRFKTINGIIQAAGLIRDAFLINKTSEGMDQVLAPKVYGTVYLDEASKDEPLDFFVMFSSLTVVLGSPGQCDYGYANSFMDHFTWVREERRARGERSGKTLSINWPPWKEGGMKVDKRVADRLFKGSGIIPLGTCTGLQAFEWGLVHGQSQLVVVEGNRETIEKSLFPGFGERHPRDLASPPSSHHQAPVDRGEIERNFQEHLLKMVANLLKIPGSSIEPHQNMGLYGFDSISFTELSQKINTMYNLGITPDIFFDHPTLSSVVSYLFKRYKDRIVEFYPGSGAASAGVGQPGPIRGVTPEGLREWDEEEEDGLFGEKANHDFPGVIRQYEPAAVIGMSGVMPQSENLGIFWQHLKAGKNLVTEIPKDRWDWRKYYGDPGQDPNKTRIKWGGFMPDADKFDPLFFNISPREAEFLDPQLRVFLEAVWHVIEDAGYSAERLSGANIGVFVGVSTLDYPKLLRFIPDPAAEQFNFMIANRVSYALNLHGPSEAIDTACSSSLTAVHRAVEALQNGACDLAIAGGVNLITDPHLFIIQANSGMLSEDGKCYTFDKRANGYVRGEGVGAILLKSLKRARADRDHIYGVIRGSVVNHCGRTNTPTTPNPAAQSQVIIHAFEKAGVDPTTVSYIETHGTGTSLGDPIEINGLKKAFEQLYKTCNKPWPPRVHCGIGSVKTNIGHLEAGAGIASMIKVLLAMKYKTIPASIHFQELNPYIKLEDSPFYIVKETVPWENIVDENGLFIPRRAGISSFGIGGTNAHVVLEEAPQTVTDKAMALRAVKEDSAGGEPYLIILSAKNRERLKIYAEKLVVFLEEAEASLIDISYTLQVGRDPMPERLAVVVRTKQELREILLLYRERAGISDQEVIKGIYTGNVKRCGNKTGLWCDREWPDEFLDMLIAGRKLDQLARVWVSGIDIDWQRLYPLSHQGPQRIILPTYPFARQRYWVPRSKAALA